MSAEQSAVPAPEEPRSKKSDNRNANLERLRIVSIFEIIGWHSSPVPPDQRPVLLLQTGLAVFLIMTSMFSLTTSQKQGYRAFLLDRVDKLFWPWLFWCAVYTVVRLFFAFWLDQPLSSGFHPLMVLYGTKSHMWYVPYAMFVAIVMGYIQLKTVKWPDGPMIAGAFILGLPAGMAVSHIVTNYDLRTPFVQYLSALPVMFFGFAFGRAVLAKPKVRNYAFLGMFLFSIPAYFYTSSQGMDLQVIVRVFRGIMMMVFVFVFPYFTKMDPITRWCSPLMFGVFLAHMLVLRGTMSIGFLADHVYVHAAVALVISMGIVWAMRMTPLKKFT